MGKSKKAVERRVEPLVRRLFRRVLCLFGKHVWQRPMFFRLNSLLGEEDFECHFCGKHKTFFNRTKTILVMPNDEVERPR